MLLARTVVILTLALASTSCKIQITTSTNGSVESDSRAYTCTAENPCDIDVTDEFFDETFRAIPNQGYTFAGWRTKPSALCGGQRQPCRLATTAFPGTPLMAILQSDQVFFLEPVFGRSNTWEPRPDTLLAGVSTSSCVVRGKLYVFGLGWGAPGKTDQFTEVEEYDPTTNSWRSRAAMPTSRAWSTTAVVRNKCYVIGGVDRFYASSPITTVEEYDPAKNSWRTMQPLPTARWGAGSAAVNGRIYVIGGTDTMSWLAVPISEVAIFDPIADEWTTGSNMPTPRIGNAVGAIDGLIYAAGGSNVPGFGLHSSDILERYNPATNQWEQGFAKLPQVVNLSSGTVLNDILYVMGGMIGSGAETTATTQRYDPVSNQWVKVVDMSASRYGLVSEVIDGQIFAVGGRPLRESPALSLTEVYTP